jgi:hypothetical protein
MRGLSPFWLTAPLWIAGACTPLPDIAPIADSNAPAPVLVPLDNLLASVDAPRATEQASNALAARATRLRARAALMRGPVLSPETRETLRQAIARGDA